MKWRDRLIRDVVHLFQIPDSFTAGPDGMVDFTSYLSEEDTVYFLPIEPIFEVRIQLEQHTSVKSLVDITADYRGGSFIRIVDQEGHFMPVIVLLTDCDPSVDDFDQDSDPTDCYRTWSVRLLLHILYSAYSLMVAECWPMFSYRLSPAKPLPSYQVFLNNHEGNW